MNQIKPGQHGREIIKRLECNINGLRRAYDVFADFLDIAERCLIDQPMHLERICAGLPTIECDETLAVWNRLHQYYPKDDKEAWNNFTEAFAILLDSASSSQLAIDSTWDVLGESFMEFGAPSSWHGQFFTPWSVAKLIAQMQYDEEPLLERLQAATDKARKAGDWSSDSTDITDAFLLAVAPHFEPVKVYDPACGSGVTLLGFASCAPLWANRFALVRYYGQDIDASCVKMARINMMLYGLNGYALRCERARLIGYSLQGERQQLIEQLETMDKEEPKFDYPVMQRPLFAMEVA